MFRKTPANLKKLKLLAGKLRGQILKPYYPLSGPYRLMIDERGLQLDFIAAVHGIKSFASLGSRASQVSFGSHQLWVADLKDVIRSKRALGTPKDLDSWNELRMKRQKPKRPPRGEVLRNLRKENERATIDQIRRLLALPMNKRTHFLRIRLPFGGSAL
jgi:hypothetical protein